jgi:hypothetical protein
MTNPIAAMIAKLQALITTMSKLGDDPVVLSYFVPGIDLMIDDIRDEILEEVNAFIPANGIVESVESEEEEEEEEDPPVEDPPVEDPPVEDPPGEGTDTEGLI